VESGGNDAPAKVEQKEEDILDSWEDCLESVDLWIPFLEVSISLNQMQICIDSTCTKSQAFNYVGVYIKDLSTTAPI
jgi:hypothetical protein